MNLDYTIVENPDPLVWDKFVCSHGGHFLQTAGWGELKVRFGWSALRLGLERDGALVAGGLVLFRPLPLGMRLAYVPRGPVVDAADRTTMSALVQALSTVARSRGAFALKLEPDWSSTDPDPLPVPLHQMGETRWPAGRPSEWVQPHTTIHLDLTCDLQTILAQMKPKWRYNIRLAERKGVTVREGGAEDMPAFHRLYQITSARDHFGIHALDYYRTALERFGDHARLFLAEYQGEPIAAIFATAFGGEAIYLYGGSANAHRERMPNHALHWHVIQWAKARGCSRYDLWGIPDQVAPAATQEEDNKEQPSSATSGSALPQGLYQFKQGFGGRIVRYAPATDLVFSRPQYVLYKWALAFKRSGLG